MKDGYKRDWRDAQSNLINLRTDGKCKNLEELLQRYEKKNQSIFKRIASFFKPKNVELCALDMISGRTDV